MGENIKNCELKCFEDTSRLIHSSLRYFIEIYKKSIFEKDFFTFMLSGGKTPLPLYEMICEYGDKINWEKVYLFVGDERIVDFSSEESNSGNIYRVFISKITIPGKNVFIIKRPISSPQQIAFEYEKIMRNFFNKMGCISNGFPNIDLILLGMGKDGHIASLFPDSDALEEYTRWVISIKASADYTVKDRITITFPVINNAKNVIIMVSGNEKKRILNDLLICKPTKTIPASLIKPSGKCLIFTDIKDITDTVY